jgi:hypothetical protein
LVAEEALISAWIAFDYPPGTGPISVYQCDDCKSYHLTSMGPMNKRLEEYLATGKIEKNKEANKWLDRIKNKNRF